MTPRGAATVAVIAAFCAVAGAQAPSGRIAGRIITPDGAAAPDADVFVARRDQPRSPIAQTRSAWDGRYQFSGLPPGAFLVGAYTDPGLVALYPGVADHERATLVNIFESVPAEGIDIWLLPAPRRFNLTGRVTDAQGRPVRNVEIEYGNPGGAQAGIWSVRQADGFFLIEGVPSGTLVMLARSETPEGLLMGLASTEVAVGAIEDVRLVLGRPGQVEGRISSENGALPAGVRPRVVLVQALLTPSALYPDEGALADADGNFRIENVIGQFRIDVRDLPEGWKVTHIMRGGRALSDRQVTVGPNARIDGLEIRVAK
jgi:hypothetical protein